jgi:hypothetical protein
MWSLPMSSEREQSPLKLVLHSTEEQLDQRVDAFADSPPSRGESTADLIKLEEKLSSAQDKAKQLVTLRLKVAEDEAEQKRSDQDAPKRAPGE